MAEAIGVSAPALLRALGGAANVKSCECAAGRLLVRAARVESVDMAGLVALGARGAVISGGGWVHVLLGPAAASACEALRAARVAEGSESAVRLSDG